MKFSIRKCLSLLAAWVVTAVPLHAEEVRVGFRADAPPFSWWSEKPVGEYKGFLADLCYAALRGSDFEVVPVRVQAGMRFEMLRKGGANGGVDMLCDPTSIPLGFLNEFILSPIVFATGVGYLRKQQVGRIGGDLRVGYLEGTTAQTAVQIALQTNAIQVVEGGQLEEVIVPNHFDGVRMVCAGEIEFYFGDLDILRSLKQREASWDNVTDSQKLTFSYEAYTLAVNANRPDVALVLQAGLYRAFSNGTVTAIYDDQFQMRTRSNALQALFALNGVLPCNGVLEDDPCNAPVGN